MARVGANLDSCGIVRFGSGGNAPPRQLPLIARAASGLPASVIPRLYAAGGRAPRRLLTYYLDVAARVGWRCPVCRGVRRPLPARRRPSAGAGGPVACRSLTCALDARELLQ